MSPPRHVVVVGGGITGLAAALALRSADDPPAVTVLEADDRLGGKLLTTPFQGIPVDAGPDAFLARVPWGAALARQVGLGDELVSPATAGARLWVRGRLRPLPEGLLMGVPTAIGPVARSGVLSVPGMVRAGLEPLLPGRIGRRTDGSVGALVRARFGHEVLERLVDPLLGGVYAGDADRMDLAATVPQLAELAARSRSLLLGARRGGGAGTAAAPAGPVFLTPRRGLGSLVDAVAARLDGVTVCCGTPVSGIGRLAGGGYDVGGHRADAVVVAAPADVSARLVADLAPRAAATLGAIPLASVAMVTLAVPERAVGRTLDATGYLVPKPEQRTVTACSWGSSKWAHWQVPGTAILRVSAGRFGDERALQLDDDALLRAVLDDLRRHLGLRGEPTEVRITRWPRAFPQYLPGHLDRVGELERDLAGQAPGVRLAGAALRGIGIPACIRQGQEAAAGVLGYLAGLDR